MKIVICTTPIRPEPTPYPPFGSLAVIQSLQLAGYDPYFYDIDGLRPTFEEVVEFFANQSPDVVGVSAVVSTAYAYTKNLALAIKGASPHTKIVVGGNLAASAELLLRFCKIDACVIGEGERTMVNLTRYWESHPAADDYSELQHIKGISYLSKSNDMTFTGYELPVPATEFLDPDWTILEKYSRIENYIIDPMKQYEYARDPRSYESHRRGKKMATLVTAKGCVARCTFCHRWDRGYRPWPVDRIVSNMKYLIARYNVGYFAWGDENFGSDRRKLDDFLERIKPMDILFNAAGVRVASVDPDVLRRMHDSGCVSIYYGMETGSPRILEIMEKNTNLQRNIDATRWTYDAGLYTIYQMVLAMPGEDHQTVKETGEFIKNATEFLPEPPHKRLSINYIQALPGTPVYEYARNTGAIGKTLEDEEQYLIKVSDINAFDDNKFLNFTEYPYFTVQSWRRRIAFEAEANWYKKRRWKPAPKVSETARLNDQMPDTEADEDYNRGGYFNLGHILIRHPLFYRIMSFPLCYPLRAMYPTVMVLAQGLVKLPKKLFFEYLREFLSYKLGLQTRPGLKDFRSLRQVMKDRIVAPETKSAESMQPLRDGR